MVPAGWVEEDNVGDEVRMCGGEGDGPAMDQLPTRWRGWEESSVCWGREAYWSAAWRMLRAHATPVVDEHEGCRSGVVLYELEIGARAIEHGECAGDDVGRWDGDAPSVWARAARAGSGACESWRMSKSVASVVWPDEEVVGECAVGEQPPELDANLDHCGRVDAQFVQP